MNPASALAATWWRSFKGVRVSSTNSDERWTEDPTGFGDEWQIARQVTGNVLRAPEQIRLAVRMLEYVAPYEVTADLFRRHRSGTLLTYDCVLRALAWRRTYDREFVRRLASASSR